MTSKEKTGQTGQQEQKLPGWLPDLPPAKNPPRGTRQTAANAAAQSRTATSADPHAQREAERYEHPIPSREALLKFLSDRAQLMTAESHRAGIAAHAAARFRGADQTPRRDVARRAAHPESPRGLRRGVAARSDSRIDHRQRGRFRIPAAGCGRRRHLSVARRNAQGAAWRSRARQHRRRRSARTQARRDRRSARTALDAAGRTHRCAGRRDGRRARRQTSASGHPDSAGQEPRREIRADRRRRNHRSAVGASRADRPGAERARRSAETIARRRDGDRQSRHSAGMAGSDAARSRAGRAAGDERGNRRTRRSAQDCRSSPSTAKTRAISTTRFMPNR